METGGWDWLSRVDWAKLVSAHTPSRANAAVVALAMRVLFP